MPKAPVNRQVRGAEIGDRLRRLMEEKGTNAFAVSKATGIDNGYFYRMLDGKREWKLRYLEAILAHLGLTLEEFFGGEVEVPVVAAISAKELFPYPQKIPVDSDRLIHYRGTLNLPILKHTYALEIKEDLLPAFTAGTMLVCQKDTYDKIGDKALVVSHDEKGMAQVYRVFFSDDSITLKGFDPAIPDRTLPRSFLKLCDLVIDIQPPML
jgi:hypothetical protein